MPTIESIVRQINREIVPQFEEKLRAYLAGQDKDWMSKIEQSALVSQKLMKIQ